MRSNNKNRKNNVEIRLFLGDFIRFLCFSLRQINKAICTITLNHILCFIPIYLFSHSKSSTSGVTKYSI